MKRLYVSLVRILRWPLQKLGLLRLLETGSTRGPRLWLRSLFSIYDIEDMIRLDLAWWTFDAMTFADRFLASRSNARVFEYGSGASTIWLGKRAGEVFSVEHDTEWSEQVSRYTREMPHVTLYPVAAEPRRDGSVFTSDREGWQDKDFELYAKQIETAGGEFDLIIIDGRARAACLRVALDFIRPDGVILFDNSKRPRYLSAIAESGLEQLETSGLTACLPTRDATMLLSKNRASLDAAPGND